MCIWSVFWGFGLRLALQFPRILTSCRWHLVQIFDYTLLTQVNLDSQTLSNLCGETGIRTPETLLEFTRFPGVPLQPLEHLSYRIRFPHKLKLAGTPKGFFTNRPQNYYKIFTYANFSCIFSGKRIISGKRGLFHFCICRRKYHLRRFGR